MEQTPKKIKLLLYTAANIAMMKIQIQLGSVGAARSVTERVMEENEHIPDSFKYSCEITTHVNYDKALNAINDETNFDVVLVHYHETMSTEECDCLLAKAKEYGIDCRIVVVNGSTAEFPDSTHTFAAIGQNFCEGLDPIFAAV